MQGLSFLLFVFIEDVSSTMKELLFQMAFWKVISCDIAILLVDISEIFLNNSAFIVFKVLRLVFSMHLFHSNK